MIHYILYKLCYFNVTVWHGVAQGFAFGLTIGGKFLFAIMRLSREFGVKVGLTVGQWDRNDQWKNNWIEFHPIELPTADPLILL